MAIDPITPPTAAPVPGDPSFREKAANFVTWLCSTLSPQINSLVAQLNTLIQFPPSGYVQAATTAEVSEGLKTDRVVTPASLVGSILPPGAVAFFARMTPPSGWLKANGASLSRASYASLFSALCPLLSGNQTFTLASTTITMNGHGLIVDDLVAFETTGNLPTGIALGTPYFVVSASTNTLNVSATKGGTAITFTGAQSGVHSIRRMPFGCADANSFNLPDLRAYFPRGWDDGRGVDSGRAFGSNQADQNLSHNHSINDPTHRHGSATTTSWNWGTASFGGGANGGDYNYSGYSATGITINNSGGTEARPKNVSLLPCIKY